MSSFFAPNISGGGRVVRAAFGVVLIVSGTFLVLRGHLAALILMAGGMFALYEALRGWCIMRACGIKTKI